MSKTFSVSGQHYLFDVQTFAHTVLAAGGDEYSYALRDRTTQGVIDDVAQGVSELGILLKTSASDAALDKAFEAQAFSIRSSCSRLRAWLCLRAIRCRMRSRLRWAILLIGRISILTRVKTLLLNSRKKRCATLHAQRR